MNLMKHAVQSLRLETLDSQLCMTVTLDKNQAVTGRDVFFQVPEGTHILNETFDAELERYSATFDLQDKPSIQQHLPKSLLMPLDQTNTTFH